ncbi:phosphoribosylformylglycinamidine synthase isoform X1 [Macrobrachium rosenbergii]|uniref:phosphoribosylformylglycinamidine synthase isoform X1 n=1 Tax=Macrobrachium rosenbergii TaxID=79674 RepID=UPI0034D53086
MSLITLYRDATNIKITRRLKKAFPKITDVQEEICYYIKTSSDIGEWDSVEHLERVLCGNIRSILGDPWLREYGVHKRTQLCIQSPAEALIEIGPRLNFTTAWGTNAMSIFHAAGMTTVVRVEKAHRYWIKVSGEISSDMRKEMVMELHDPMTEQEYKEPLKSFGVEQQPEKWFQVDVLHRGRKALEEANVNMGLAFDDWDLDYYTEIFRDKVQRNPTTVELFDLAQSNSEHSRHWFFKGDYTADGEPLKQSLLDMVISTNKHPSTNKNNIIAFSDNSSGIKGWKTTALTVNNPSQASCFVQKTTTRHLIFTAETHNFPTGVAPFSGATTGTGGRIRDVQAVGRGGHVIAGTAGYCFGNLHIPGYLCPWEPEVSYPPNFASSLEVAIEASNGASDYGNKFGEPVIAGFARSCGLFIGDEHNQERREWIKPIMFSGGIGTLDEEMISKLPPKRGLLVMKIGGPAYRIGVGGGAASSVQVQGDNTATRDLGAVQRGDAEMGQKLNRVIRGCLEMERNPILSIHDQGAGGNANVLKELMEGAGGDIYSKSFSVGDPSLSTLEIWGAEYQESNAILVPDDQLGDLQCLAERERCPIDTVGVITGDQKVRLIEEKLDINASLECPGKPATKMNPVDLELDLVLGSMPKKKFHWTKSRANIAPLKLQGNLSVMEALELVLKLPSVASKRYLTNKVDRSVTGLVAQQQCVGPLHTPAADVAVIAHSYFHKEGAATSIGEQPLKILANPSAGARMTVLEALSNLAASPITDIKDVKCSANWMWAAKLSGEGWAIYEACNAMCEIMTSIGIAVDGGKDSLSMAARVTDSKGNSTVVKAPGALVVSAYAPCPDITKVVTPDLKGPSSGSQNSLIWVRPVTAYARLAGTALAQVFSQVGRNCPDIDQQETVSFIAAFNVIQELLKEEDILSLHDVSDGGLITCLVEMGISGWGGFTVNVPPAPAPPSSFKDNLPPILSALFSEEVGWVMEIHSDKVEEVVQKFHCAGVPGTCPIGVTTEGGPEAQIQILVDGAEVVNSTVLELTKMWEKTSFLLEQHQMNPDCAESEHESFSKRKHVGYHIPFSYKDFVTGVMKSPITEVRVAVIREEGSNGDREMAAALMHSGFTVYDVTMTDIFAGRVSLNDFRGIIFPGGFSYADVLGSAVGWAASIQGRTEFKRVLESWKNRPDTFSLGVCNGCQLVALLGWLNPVNQESDVTSVRLTENISGRFESRWSRVCIESSNSILLAGMEGAKMGIWVAHGEGRFVYSSSDVLASLISSRCIAMRYIDDEDQPTKLYPMNPNGSEGGVAGITSPCGRHLALMPHPERCVLRWQWPHMAEPLTSSPHKEYLAAPWARLFQNGFNWCLENKG